MFLSHKVAKIDFYQWWYVMITVPTVVQKLQNYKYLTVDMNSPCCSKRLLRMAPGGTNTVLLSRKQDRAIFTVFHLTSHGPSKGCSGRGRPEGIQHVSVSIGYQTANQFEILPLWAFRCYKKAPGLALGSFWFLNLAASQTPINSEKEKKRPRPPAPLKPELTLSLIRE